MISTIAKRLQTAPAKKIILRTSVAKWHPPPPNYDPQFGEDYPQMPWIPYDKRSPYQHWDDPIHRRNFGETIPEEFDVQDAYFPGEHDPVYNLTEGLKGQLWIAGFIMTFGAIAYLTYNPYHKPMPREIPESVFEHMRTAGKDRVSKRPYEVAGFTPNSEGIIADKALARMIALDGGNKAHSH